MDKNVILKKLYVFLKRKKKFNKKDKGFGQELVQCALNKLQSLIDMVVGHGEVELINDRTGEVLFEGHNAITALYREYLIRSLSDSAVNMALDDFSSTNQKLETGFLATTGTDGAVVYMDESGTAAYYLIPHTTTDESTTGDDPYFVRFNFSFTPGTNGTLKTLYLNQGILPAASWAAATYDPTGTTDNRIHMSLYDVDPDVPLTTSDTYTVKWKLWITAS
jgi:hypothetical protein